MIYAVAIFTFYCVISSIVNVIRYHKYSNPILSAQKEISLAKALVAVFVLQTAMFASFNNNVVVEKTMNTITSIVVCFVIFFMAVLMVRRANKNIKKLRINNSETKLKQNSNI